MNTENIQRRSTTMAIASKGMSIITSLVLLIAAALKMHEVLTQPFLTDAILESRSFTAIEAILITGLAIWLLSGLFAKAGWILAVVSFVVFCAYTFNQMRIGADTCGCFGAVKVDPKISLFLIDLPIILALILLRPRGLTLLPPPWPKLMYFISICIFTSVLLGSMAIAAYAIVPAQETDTYAVIDHDGWVGLPLPMLKQIDVAPELLEGFAVIFLYHDNCPTCREMAPVYSEMYEMLGAAEQDIKFAFIEMPPYGDGSDSPIPVETQCIVGVLDETKKWYGASPILIVTEDGIVKKSWEAEIPATFEELFEAVFGE